MASRTPPRGVPSGSIRPARSYNDSALICSAAASWLRISADGLRRPRSICDRYGLLTPAWSARRRMLILPISRWDLMNSPSSVRRLSSSSRTSTTSAPTHRRQDGHLVRLAHRRGGVGIVAVDPHLAGAEHGGEVRAVGR